MSEKQTSRPEAPKQLIVDLYQQAADYLETALHKGTATIEPALYERVNMLTVSTEVPILNGRKLKLEYDRPARNDDPTQVDRDTPLAYTDDSGKNHWWTPIGIKVYDESNNLLHDYDVMTATDPQSARAYDKYGEEDPATGELPKISVLDANEFIAHIEWGLEEQAQA